MRFCDVIDPHMAGSDRGRTAECQLQSQLLLTHHLILLGITSHVHINV